MKQLIKLLPIIIPYYFFVAFLHQFFYYSGYRISIAQWLGVTELVSLFFDDILAFIMYGIVIYIGSYGAIWAKEHLTKNKPVITGSKKKKALRRGVIQAIILIVPAVILLSALYMIVRMSDAPFDKGADTILAAVVLIVSAPLVFMKEQIEEVVGNRLRISSIMITIFCVSIFAHAFVNALKKQNYVFNSKTRSIVILKDENKTDSLTHLTIDSLTYLGKSDNYFFLIDKKTETSFVLEKNRIERIDIYDSTAKKYFTILH